MFKIQTTVLETVLVIHMEGRLAGPFVPVLESLWLTASSSHPDHSIVVDLKGITFIDRCGRSLLQFLHRHGVSFQRAGLAVQDILDEILEPPRIVVPPE